MTIGNRTRTPRAIKWLGNYITIAPMGMFSAPDNADTKAELKRLKSITTFKVLLDTGVLVINEHVNEHAAPVVPPAPQPPSELLAEPENPRVNKGKPKKTKETMKV